MGNFTDERGILLWVSQKLLDFDFKYITIGSIKPGCKRGGHYHKKTYEQFMCVNGKIEYMRDEDSTVMEAGDIVEVPVETMHTFVNVGEDTAYFLEFKSTEFDKLDPDMYSRKGEE